MEQLTVLLLTAFTSVTITHSFNKWRWFDDYEKKMIQSRYLPEFCLWCFNFWLNFLVCGVIVFLLDLHIGNQLMWIPSAGLSFHYVKTIR